MKPKKNKDFKEMLIFSTYVINEKGEVIDSLTNKSLTPFITTDTNVYYKIMHNGLEIIIDRNYQLDRLFKGKEVKEEKDAFDDFAIQYLKKERDLMTIDSYLALISKELKLGIDLKKEIKLHSWRKRLKEERKIIAYEINKIKKVLKKKHVSNLFFN